MHPQTLVSKQLEPKWRSTTNIMHVLYTHTRRIVLGNLWMWLQLMWLPIQIARCSKKRRKNGKKNDPERPRPDLG